MKALTNTALILAAAFTLTSCGSVSPVTSSATGTSTNAIPSKVYSKVLVEDFRDLAGSGDAKAGAQFAGIIAGEVLRKRPSATVLRSGTADANTLVIGGDITRYNEGNAALRLLVGMGAGSSYFDAIIRLKDGTTGSTLSTLKADKNSWGLGGSIAAQQTVETFMNEAAKKTVQQALPLLK